MTRLVGLLIGLVFLVTACGSAEGTPATNSVPDAAASVSTSVAPASGDSTVPPSSDSTVGSGDAQNPSGVEGPTAPDFSLVLADGSTFTLSEGSKPVYMVFWAEW